MKRIMISGAIAGHPLFGAGNTWAFLQYILGFRSLGFETYYVEHLSSQECVADDWAPTDFSASANARYFRALIERFGLAGHAALLEWDGTGYIGLSQTEIEKIAPEIDLLVNLSGRMHLKTVLGAARRRMYIDLDPGYSQVWQQQYGEDMNLRGHDFHVTVGLNLGQPDCPFPTCGIRWHTTLPPVVLGEWADSQSEGAAYTTVGDWRSFASIKWRGIWYHQKAHEFKRILSLPRRVPVPLELCLFIDAGETDRIELEEHGWRLVSPSLHAATPDSYRKYIVSSRGEFTAVKHGYAAGRTGWFSDRSACYLAAGRPVIMQDTGFAPHIATGDGLVTFDDTDSAVDALNRVENDYAHHAAAAAAFAREYLDSNLVLPRLLRLADL